MTKAAGSRSAKLACVGLCALTAMECTRAAPEIDVHLPVVEREIYVDVPGRTTLSPDDLRERYYRGRRTLFHMRARCVTTPKVDGSCATTTDVRITAVEGAKYIDADKRPNRPQLIAWVDNLGTSTTFDGIQPVDVARYALVVDTIPHVNPAILLVEFPAERAPRGTLARATPYGRVYKCHNYRQPLISDADYQVCRPHRSAAALPKPASLAKSLLFTSMLTWTTRSAYDDPTWFSCSSGCCSSASTIALSASIGP